MNRFFTRTRDRRSRGCSGSFRPRLEGLEERCCPTTVTSLDDSGPGTLREAIAITDPAGTVDFQAGLTGTITLTSGELAIAKDLTVAGPGSPTLTISGNDVSRVFNIAPTFTVAISGLTLTHGRAINGGGAINNGGTLNLSGLTLTQSNGARGGGAINNGGTLSLTNSAVSLNHAVPTLDIPTAGGGIYNTGALTIVSSTLSDNDARGGLGSNPHNVLGGGIYNTGTLTIVSSTLSNNSVSAITNRGDVLNVAGGGIYNMGTLTLTSSTLRDNFASALESQPSAYASNGGGIYNGSSGWATIDSSTLSNNSTTTREGRVPLSVPSYGGGISNAGTLTLTNSTLSGNSAILDNLSSYGNAAGGGIFSSDGILTITSSTISSNNSTSRTQGVEPNAQGGGIFVSGSSVVNLRNTILAGNTARFGSPDIGGSLASQGYNLIGDGSGGSGFADTDQVGTSDNPIDPQLQPLDDYGGPTLTQRPLPSSPAVDAGDPTDAPDTDQRGFARTVNGLIDIGAVELQPDERGGFPRGGSPAEQSRIDALFGFLWANRREETPA